MKLFFIVQLIILLTADLFFGLSIAGCFSETHAHIITFLDMFIGPVQIAPALALIFFKKNQNIYFWSYLVLALCTIGSLIVSVSLFHFGGYHDDFFLAMMHFSFLLAHYFVYVLYKTLQINKIS